MSFERMRYRPVNSRRCSRSSGAPNLSTTRCASSLRRGGRGIRTETIGTRMVAWDLDTTRLIDRLAKAGLVSRTRSEEDRRCVVVGMNQSIPPSLESNKIWKAAKIEC